MHHNAINHAFGNIDLYLLDQVLKGRFEGKKTLLDAGCGEGRNLRYFADQNFELYGNDIEPMAIKMVQMSYPKVTKDNFTVKATEDLTYPSNFFDIILCGAVLHFAKSQNHFDQMLDQLAKLVKKGGVLFIRMATNIGIDGITNSTFTYHLNEDEIHDTFSKRNLIFIEPWKSVVVEGQRSMGTFILSKV